MRVLYHLSHCSSTLPDGWSGAPGEAQWVRDLVASVKVQAAPYGITVYTVDGDLADHPAFHADYDAFVAPHYEADVHNEDGGFWGRASASLTPTEDDQLGGAIWSELRTINGYQPPERFNWNNVNVTDYYGFRLTSNKTPGALIEHGVGNRHPQAYTYLRDNLHVIAAMHVDALCILGGITTMPFDPFNNPADLKRFDQRVREILMGEPALTAFALKKYLNAPGPLGTHNVGPDAEKAEKPQLRELTPEQKSHDGHGKL